MRKHIQLDDESIGDLFKQLSLLIHSEILLSDALRIISEKETENDIKDLLLHLADETELGERLSAALESTKLFPSYIIGLLSTGEVTGKLEETLSSISNYYHSKHKRKKKLTDALTYPCILLILMAVIIVVLLTQVLPIFNDVYASLGGGLSGIAYGLIAFGNKLNSALPYIGLFTGILLIAGALIFMITPLKQCFSNFFSRLFGDRGVYRKMNNASFIQALSVAYSSGLSLEESVDLAGQILKDNFKASERVQKCITLIENGSDLDEALKTCKFLSASAAYMLKLSLRAGSADETILSIADQISEDAEESVNDMISKIEPTLVILTSLITGAILLTVMLPLINIMKTIG